MAAQVEIIRTTAPIDGSSVDYNFTGFGAPQAAIIVMNTAASSSAVKSKCIGYYDGTTQLVQAADDLDGASTTASNRCQITGVVALADSATPIGVATGWSANGITIDWAVFSDAYDIEIILFKGLSNAKVNKIALDTSPVTLSATFKPDMLFCSSSLDDIDNRTTANGLLSLGVAHNDSVDSISQMNISFSGKDSGLLVYNTSILRDDSILTGAYNLNENYRAAATNFSTSGVELTVTSGSADGFVYGLMIELPDPDDGFVGTFTSPTTVSTKAVTGMGFTPEIAGVLSVRTSALNTLETNSDEAYATCIGSATDTVEASFSAYSDDGADPSALDETATAAIIYLTNDLGILKQAATVDSFDSDGVTFDFTTAEATARPFGIWAIGGSSDKELSVTPGSYDLTGTSVSFSVPANSESGNLWFNSIWWPSPFFGTLWFGPTSHLGLEVSSGSYDLTGTAVTLESTGADIDLTVTSGAFELTGPHVALSQLFLVTSGAYSLTGSSVTFQIEYTSDEFIISNNTTFDGHGIVYGADIAYNSDTDVGYTILSRVDKDSVLLDGIFGAAPQPYKILKYVDEVVVPSVIVLEFDGDDWRTVSKTTISININEARAPVPIDTTSVAGNAIAGIAIAGD